MATAITPHVAYEKERASPRLTLTIPIVIRGKDSSGRSVIEKTHTVVVNRRGAKVLTCHSFPVGAPLQVAVPHLKRLSEAKIAWLGPRDTEFQAIGIDLGQCGDFWGVELMETPPGTLEEASDQSGNARSNTQVPTNPAVADHKNGNHAPAPLPAGSPEPSPQLQADRSAKLSSAIEELVQTAIEQSLAEVLPRVNREADEALQARSRAAIEQAHTHVHRLVEEAITKLEAQVAEILARNEKTWQQTFQELTQTSQERLEASLSECQDRLAQKAESVRHELAHKLADLSTILHKD